MPNTRPYLKLKSIVTFLAGILERFMRISKKQRKKIT